jgi:transcriptional regulator with XRE-family HTH domain
MAQTSNVVNNLETIAENLERSMRHHGLSEQALARASGISPRTVGNFLRPSNRYSKSGTSRSFPSGTLANLVNLAEALGLEAWELLRKRDSARAKFLLIVEQAYIDREQVEADAARKRARRTR